MTGARKGPKTMTPIRADQIELSMSDALKLSLDVWALGVGFIRIDRRADGGAVTSTRVDPEMVRIAPEYMAKPRRLVPRRVRRRR